MATAVFLPGAGGRASFWQPAVSLLDRRIEPLVLGWPGFGDLPRDDSIRSLRDLVDFVRGHVSSPVDLLAQSMGGVVALTFALEYPQLVRRLVLTGTSGGVDVVRFGGEDWRAESLANDVQGHERTPRWFIDDRSDLTAELASITAPTLLIWGEDDRISPPAVGHYLAEVLPNAELVLVPGGHDHPSLFPETIAALVHRFLLNDHAPIVSKSRLKS